MLLDDKNPKLKSRLVAIAIFLILILILTICFYLYQIKFKKSLNKSTNQELLANNPTSLKIDKLDLWLDLELIKDGFTADRVNLYKDKILLLDLKNKSVLYLNTHSKQKTTLGGGDTLGEVKFADLSSTGAIVYSNSGIFKLDALDESVKQVVLPDPELTNIGDLTYFAGNIYLLDRSSKNIWKYIGTETGLTSKQSYLREGESVNLSTGIRMRIDSSVWVLGLDNSFYKLTAGMLDNFSLSGLSSPIKDLRSFFVSDETEKIYFLDSKQGRVVVTDKSGLFQNEYRHPDLKKMIDLVVDEKEGKKIFLLDGKKIYSFNLQ